MYVIVTKVRKGRCLHATYIDGVTGLFWLFAAGNDVRRIDRFTVFTETTFLYVNVQR